MAISINKKKQIEDVIITSLQIKFQSYNPESSNMPFHYRLLGKDRMALYSFIQSLNTTFGTSIFEPVAVELARDNFSRVEKQYVIGDNICESCQKIIQQIINNLSVGKNPINKTN